MELTIGPICGFQNIGNSCYLNSLIQALMSIPQFNQSILNDTEPNELVQAYKRVLGYKQLEIHNLQQILNILIRLSKGRFRWGSQEDSHESLMLLFSSFGKHSAMFELRQRCNMICECGYKLLYPGNETEKILQFNSEITSKALISQVLYPPNYKCDGCGIRNTVDRNPIKQVYTLTLLSDVIVITFPKYDRKVLHDFPFSLAFRMKGGEVKEYTLCATIDHFGDQNGGHYTAKALRVLTPEYIQIIKEQGYTGSLIPGRKVVLSFNDANVAYCPSGFTPTPTTYITIYASS